MPRATVTLIATWGNGDATSQIKISPSLWADIRGGASHSHSAWSRYEGHRYPVRWRFGNAKVSIEGDDGMECWIEEELTSLQVVPSSNP